MRSAPNRPRPGRSCGRVTAGSARARTGAHAARLPHADFPGPAGAVALEPTPALLLAVAAQRLPEDLCLGAAFLLGQAFRFSDQVRGKREQADSCGGHPAILD